MFLLLIGTLLCGILPVFVKNALFKCECLTDVCKRDCRARRGKLITSFLIYFGGGVLLGTCLLHLLPEAREKFEDHDDHDDTATLHNSTDIFNQLYFHDSDGGGEEFSMTEFIVCCGFFAVYLFEEIVHFFLGGHSHVPTETRAIRSLSRSSSCVGTPRLSQCSISVSGEYKPQPPTALTQASVELREPPKLTDTFSVAGLLTVAALSFHSLFEGFAIGLRPDAKSTWFVFAAVAFHKYVIAFVVGLEVLAGGGKNIQVYIYMTVFAFMSPIGMAIAMITSSNVEDSSPLTVGVLNAIATGTLLYVTFMEILQREEKKDIATWIQLIATFSGFCLMALMQYISTFA